MKLPNHAGSFEVNELVEKEGPAQPKLLNEAGLLNHGVGFHPKGLGELLKLAKSGDGADPLKGTALFGVPGANVGAMCGLPKWLKFGPKLWPKFGPMAWANAGLKFGTKPGNVHPNGPTNGFEFVKLI